MTSIYQGDPRQSITRDGLTLSFVDGQCKMDKGLVNAVINTLLYNPWFLNAEITDDIYYIGSDFLKYVQRPITVANLALARAAGLKALQWMITAGMASEIDVRLRNPSGSIVEVLVLIKPPAKTRIALFATKYGLNWKFQIDEG